MTRWLGAAFSVLLMMQLAAGVAMDLTYSSSNLLLPRSEEAAISPRKDLIVWCYKEINGQLYRRQYNQSKDKWIGDWEAC